jgi:hypothetical protein
MTHKHRSVLPIKVELVLTIRQRHSERHRHVAHNFKNKFAYNPPEVIFHLHKNRLT